MMRPFCAWALALVALSIATLAAGQEKARPDVLNRVLKLTRVDGKSLPETARLLEGASGVEVRLSPEIQQCITGRRLGCDWQIHTNWGGQTLAEALETLCGSASLDYTVVEKDTILITRRQSRK
jgi:hypothetical protein